VKLFSFFQQVIDSLVPIEQVGLNPQE